MAIYFGNLDRELAERQNVLKEDAARQYQGSREVMAAFSDLGTQVASNIERLGVPEWLRGDATLDKDGNMIKGGWGGAGTQDVEVARIDYNLHRQTESDKIRNEQHRDLRLQRRLTNIEGYQKVRAQQHSALQWNNFNPQAVQKKYDNRMKVLDKDLTNVAPVERILAYPQLFGAAAVKAVKTLRKLERAGDEKGAKEARANLPLAPLPYMEWAVEQKYFNDKITGNPLAVGNRMYTSALREAGYDIPDAEDLYRKNKGTLVSNADSSKEYDPLKEKEEAAKLSDIKKQLEILKKGKLQEKSGHGSLELTEKDTTVIPETIEALKDVVLGTQTTRHPHGGLKTISKDDLQYLKDTGGASYWMNQLDSSKLPTGSENWPIPPDEKDEVAAEGKTTYYADGSIKTLSPGDAKYLNFVEGVQGNTPNLSAGQSDNVTMTEAADSGNQFTLDLGNTLKSWGVYGRTKEAADRMNQENKAIGAEVKKKMESRDREELSSLKGALDYKTLPSYKETDSWVTLSKEKKNELLNHPAVDVYGASSEKVFNYEKAKEKLEDKDHEIFMLHNPLKKYSPLKDLGSSFNKLVAPASKYGGKVGTDVELSSLIDKYNAKMPLLQEERKELMAKFNRADKNMVASQTKDLGTSATYKGSLASDYGVSNDPGLPTIRPRPTVDPTLGMALAPGSTATEPLYVDPKAVETDQDTGMIDAGKQQKIYNTAVKTIIDKEGHGTEGEGHMYFDGENPTTSGDFNVEGSQNLVLAGGNNIYDTINSITNKDKRDAELEEVAFMLFGKGGEGKGFLGFGRNNKDEFLRYMNMPKKDHKAYYSTHEQRSAVKLSQLQRNDLTDYSMNNHLERLIEKHPYLNNIARYPKEMQLFIMDNAFNMGPNWLGKFTKMEGHLKKWVEDGYKKSDLKLVMKEYKDSDHFRKKISKARALENYERLESMLG